MGPLSFGKILSETLIEKFSSESEVKKKEERKRIMLFARDMRINTTCFLEKLLAFPGISWTAFVGLILINKTADIF